MERTTTPDTRSAVPGGSGDGKDVGELVGELWELIKAYLRQETIDPIKGLGRYVLFGVAGALLVGTGAILLAVGLSLIHI